MNSGSTSASSLNPESDVDLKKESCVKHVDVLWFCYCESATAALRHTQYEAVAHGTCKDLLAAPVMHSSALARVS